MQRDFMINALRTKTKYNLTSIRKGMKKEILQGLMEMFDKELRMVMPMVHFKESMESDYAGTEVSVKFIEAQGGAACQEDKNSKNRHSTATRRSFGRRNSRNK